MDRAIQQLFVTVLLTIASLVVLFVVFTTNFDNQSRTQTIIIEFHSVPALTPEPQPQPIKPLLDSAELICLAKNVYFESRGESEAGQLAVAHVTMNRVYSPNFPNTVCDVVYQAVHSKWWWEAKGKLVPVRHQCQFSWYCDGKSDTITDVEAWEKILLLSEKVLLGETEDNTHGATFYYNPTLADPDWKYQLVKTATVDNHKFMRMP